MSEDLTCPNCAFPLTTCNCPKNVELAKLELSPVILVEMQAMREMWGIIALLPRDSKVRILAWLSHQFNENTPL